jgi:hypothetical protein
MSILKATALVAMAVALNGAQLSAQALTAECGTEVSQPRLIGLDRSEADVCLERFMTTPPPTAPVLPPSVAATSAREPAGSPEPEGRDGTCMRFVPTLAMTMPVPCPAGGKAP